MQQWPQQPSRYRDLVGTCSAQVRKVAMKVLELINHVNGLQVFKDREWISVEPISQALVVNIGHQLQIISNGKLKSAEHRAVTSSSHSRTSAAFFTAHSDDCIGKTEVLLETFKLQA
ncbi:hypothetical protein ACFX15_003896 [Malus domestica]